MRKIIDATLATLEAEGNLRRVPEDAAGCGRVDLSSNDYLGLAECADLRRDFFAEFDCTARDMAMSASASRLLAARQHEAKALEALIEEAYGRPALLFNSGYHANTGIIGALGAIKGTYILADKLVHASIIDGIRLSGAPFARFRHNDYAHLERLAEKAAAEGYRLLIIAESVYSMDGDCSDVEALLDVRDRYEGAMLYIDEAHAVGVEGPAGLGLAHEAERRGRAADVIIGTFGKALASVGAYAVVDAPVREFLVNRARSFIFSTSLPPVNLKWSRFMFRTAMGADTLRQQLASNAQALSAILRPFGGTSRGHIQPLVVGSPQRAVALSAGLKEAGFDVLPIRVPTVPPGTDRLRFSLSAGLTPDCFAGLGDALAKLI
ncbi:MAG: 8-amino-7-oxononanoate synthase [Bacteroidales bacterium]|nr:8-amino-7-oxononanoate synthase [Bacteroidales bacterium]